MDSPLTTYTDDQRIGPRILVAGLGNSILTDDGIGVHAALALQDTPGVCAVEVGTAVLDALHLFEWADRILAIDAMEAGGEPGQIYLLGENGLAGATQQVSLHELSLKATLRFAAEPITPDIVILGVEPEVVDFGLELSPALQAALPRVLSVAREVIAHWRDPQAQRTEGPVAEALAALEA
jgi:hydrogenase maturation protease